MEMKTQRNTLHDLIERASDGEAEYFAGREHREALLDAIDNAESALAAEVDIDEAIQILRDQIRSS